MLNSKPETKLSTQHPNPHTSNPQPANQVLNDNPDDFGTYMAKRKAIADGKPESEWEKYV
jgi:hypothetical protein